MTMFSKTIGLIGLAAVTFATPSMAQTFSIGPDGVRVMEEQRPRGERMERRDRREETRRGEVSEREAIRIARSEGVREVDEVRRTRSSYRIDGFDRRGNDIRVDVDRRSGAVIAVR